VALSAFSVLVTNPPLVERRAANDSPGCLSE